MNSASIDQGLLSLGDLYIKRGREGREKERGRQDPRDGVS